MDIKNKKICFLGDSITEGVGASVPEKSYVNIFKQLSGAHDVWVDGISGTRIARQQNVNPDLLSWDTNEFPRRVRSLPPDRDVIVVFGGTNDYDHGDAGFGRFSDRTPDTFCGALHVLMSSLIDRYPDAVILFLTPLHRVGEMERNRSNHLTLKSYVNMIRRTAEYYSIPVLDLYAVSGMQPNIESQNREYFSDGVHPNDKGHRVIAEKLYVFMKSFL